MKIKGLLFLSLFLLALIYIQGCSSSDDSPTRRFHGIPNPPLLGATQSGPHTHNNAVGVYWNKKLWLFYSTEDDSGNEIHYKTFAGSSMSDGVTIKTGDNSDQLQYSKALTSPVIVNRVMYLFFTGTNGKLYYIYLDPETNKWDGSHRISDSILLNTGTRYAAVFNTLSNNIEIYWVPEDSSTIYYARRPVDKNGYLTGSWQGFKTLVNSGAAGSRHLSAVFNQDDSTGITYLAWVNGSRNTVIGRVKFDNSGNPSIQKTDTFYTSLASNGSDGVSLVDISEDLMALINNTPSHRYISLYYFDKKNGSWRSSDSFDAGSTNDWTPTGVVYYQETSDNASYTKYRYDAVFYIINGEWDNNLQARSTWKMRSADHMGYWMPLSATTINTASKDEYLPLCSILGVVDAPPFVKNGDEDMRNNNYCTSGHVCTRTEFEVAYDTTQTLSGEVKGGPYMESGKKCPITFEVSAGLSGAYDKSTSYAYTSKDPIEQTMESKIMAFYLCPSFQTFKLEWHDYNGNATGNYTYPVKVLDDPKPQVLKRVFTPDAGPLETNNASNPYIKIPNHKSEDDMSRLLTYVYSGSTNPTGYSSLFDPITKTWAGGSPPEAKWSISNDTSISKGAYVDFKIGAEFAKAFGVGVSGSFEMYTKSSIKKDVSVTLVLSNPEAAVKGDIERFDVIAYWLKPDQNAYWIPENRKGLGDTPFFITYSVNKDTIGVRR